MYIIEIGDKEYYWKTKKNGDTLTTLKKKVAYKFDIESMAELHANSLRMKFNYTIKVIEV
jgi:hypothetical protein